MKVTFNATKVIGRMSLKALLAQRCANSQCWEYFKYLECNLYFKYYGMTVFLLVF